MAQRPDTWTALRGTLPPLFAALAVRRPSLVLWLSLYVIGGVVVLGAIASTMLEQRSRNRDVREIELLREVETREVQRHELQAAVDRLERTLAERDRELALAESAGERLQLALAQEQAERIALEDERRRARERARTLDRGARQTALWLETAERERLAVERERAALVERLAAAEDMLRLGEEERERLRWRLTTAETRVARLEAEQQEAARWLTSWIEERLGAIETVLHRTGLEPERMLARLVDDRLDGANSHGRGGPLLPLSGGHASAAGHRQDGGDNGILGLGEPATATLIDDLGRLETALRLIAAVPLGTPFDHFHLTSRFGQRTDPFTRRRALHSGLDFGAPAGSAVLATAPGRVVHAGRAGSYGIMVEIDHGQGITTRYAHLSRVDVAVGDVVTLRQPVAVIGSTGRSTGRHLHYEVRIDDQPRDPARFIAAGRDLASILGGQG